jgi:hypothetical protein
MLTWVELNNITTKPMATKTAMQQLLNQMREERSKLPIPIEWDRAYQAIEMMIEHTYILMEKEQIIHAFEVGFNQNYERQYDTIEEYYNETYGK